MLIDFNVSAILRWHVAIREEPSVKQRTPFSGPPLLPSAFAALFAIMAACGGGSGDFVDTDGTAKKALGIPNKMRRILTIGRQDLRVRDQR